MTSQVQQDLSCSAHENLLRRSQWCHIFHNDIINDIFWMYLYISCSIIIFIQILRYLLNESFQLTLEKTLDFNFQPAWSPSKVYLLPVYHLRYVVSKEQRLINDVTPLIGLFFIIFTNSTPLASCVCLV